MHQPRAVAATGLDDARAIEVAGEDPLLGAVGQAIGTFHHLRFRLRLLVLCLASTYAAFACGFCRLWRRTWPGSGLVGQVIAS